MNYFLQKQLFAEDLAIRAGELAKDFYLDRQTLSIETKDYGEFVSEADRIVEKMMRDEINDIYPQDGFLGEEAGGVESDSFWCVDPIDGTSNFLSGIPLWGVSIAYCDNTGPRIGAISIPMQNILLSACDVENNIRMNGTKFAEYSVSLIPTIAIGESPHWERGSIRKVEDKFINIGLECVKYRCCVVGLAFAALGKTHGYYEEQTNLWDVAAGFVICQQAGLVSQLHRSSNSDKVTISVSAIDVNNQVGSGIHP